VTRARAFAPALLFALGACTHAAPHVAATHSPSPRASAPSGGARTLRARVVAHMPQPLSRVVAMSGARGDVLVASGLDRANRSSDGVLRFDPAAAAATPGGTLAAAVHDAAGATLGGRAFVFGGGAARVTDAVQRVTGGARASVVAHLPRARADLSCAVLGDAAYIVGGYDGTRATPEILRTTDGVTFEKAGTLAVPVRYAAVVATADAVYVFGGQRAPHGADTDVIQRIDRSGGASVVGHLPRALSHATAALLGGVPYVFGGRESGTATAAILRFDVSSASVARAGALPRALSDMAAAAAGDAVYLFGGEGRNAADAADDIVEIT
jgi:hypothetical protein